MTPGVVNNIGNAQLVMQCCMMTWCTYVQIVKEIERLHSDLIN